MARLIPDALRILITIAIIIGVGCLVGFRFQAGVGPAIAVVALSMAFGLAICCVSAFVSLAIKNQESVQGSA